MPHSLRVSKLTALACALLSCTASAKAAPADDAVQLALHTAPNTRVTVARTAVHVVSYDMNHTLMSLLGNRVAPTTLIDSRTATIDVSADGARIVEDATVLRRFGGTDPKDKSVVTRHDHYAGSLSHDGVRTPAVARLGDAGDGALDQLPATPLRVGQTWTFSRPIGIDRTLGDGTMTYTDTLAGLADRNGHRIASITVAGVCVAQPAADLQAKGFHPSSYTLHGSAEFDVTSGTPGVQHYDGQVEWIAHVMFSKIGIKFADTYDSSGWTLADVHR
jgi:hypothetical protein